MSAAPDPAAGAPLAPVQVPFPVTAPHQVRPTPTPLTGSPTVELDDAWPAAVARRKQRLRTDLEGVLVGGPVGGSDDPGLAAALRAAWSLLPLPGTGRVVTVPHLHLRVDLAAASVEHLPDGDDGLVALLAPLVGVRLLAAAWLLACSDDLVVLHRTGPGGLVAELLAVAFPSGWPPRERRGATLAELHAPVADGERLARASPALSEALLRHGPLRQHVWGFEVGGRLDRDPSAPDADPPEQPADPQRWWLRVERQTSIPLPHLGRALFCIRPYLVPLTSLRPDRRRVLADAVASMSPATRAYKGIDRVADGLVDWLRTTPGTDAFS